MQYVFVVELIKYIEMDKKKIEIDIDILFDSCYYIKRLVSLIKYIVSLEIK